MTSKASSSGLHLSFALIPSVLSVLYVRWNSLPTILDMSTIQEPGSPLYHNLSTNVTSVSAFDRLHDQYARACPEHSYKTRIFSMDPLVIYLENYITAPEREYIMNMAEPQYTKSEVLDLLSDGYVDSIVPDYRSSQTAEFFEDPVGQCIAERSAYFQGNMPANHVEDLQVVKYTVGDHYQHHWDWWESSDNPRISTLFAYLACDSGESGSGGQCEGGATHFPHLRNDFPPGWCDAIDCYDDSELGGVAFKPVVGNAIFWSNVHPNSTYHRGTYHAGMPVKKGQKIGLNIWTHRDKFLYDGPVGEDELTALS
ncbi:Prolyl 4-hydroxylase, alpha polypeptide [Xylographa pallens]|nr:Prolyl 4-hydroxylase, alpha polypeptide [Xylographa pallens]